MMQDNADFQKKFGLAYDGPPRELPEGLAMLKNKHLLEELYEYRIAVSLEKKLDALVDLVYVAVGTAYQHGFDFNEAWRRVHAANMTKVRAQPDGSDSARGSGYDIVKPKDFVPPDLSDLVS